MRNLLFPLVILFVLFFNQEPAAGENYYKWIDKDGVTHVTDNPQKVPSEYRSNLEIVKEKDTGFKAFTKNIQKQLNNNRSLIFCTVAAVFGLFLLNKLLKKFKDKSKVYKKSRYDDFLKKSGIDLMTSSQFRTFTKNLLSTKGFKVQELKSDLDFGIDYTAQKSNSNYLVKVISDNVMTSRTLLNDIMREASRYGCDKAIFITKNFFSDDAVEFSKSAPCDLIDRNTLGKWIKESRLY